MLYILGPGKEFRQQLKHRKPGKPLMAKGRDGDYDGCSVWEKRAHAEAYLHAHRKERVGCEVFGIRAKWLRDTLPARERERQEAKGGDQNAITFRDLMRSAEIVALPPLNYGLVKAEIVERLGKGV